MRCGLGVQRKGTSAHARDPRKATQVPVLAQREARPARCGADLCDPLAMARRPRRGTARGRRAVVAAPTPNASYRAHTPSTPAPHGDHGRAHGPLVVDEPADRPGDDRHRRPSRPARSACRLWREHGRWRRSTPWACGSALSWRRPPAGRSWSPRTRWSGSANCCTPRSGCPVRSASTARAAIWCCRRPRPARGRSAGSGPARGDGALAAGCRGGGGRAGRGEHRRPGRRKPTGLLRARGARYRPNECEGGSVPEPPSLFRVRAGPGLYGNWVVRTAGRPFPWISSAHHQEFQGRRIPMNLQQLRVAGLTAVVVGAVLLPLVASAGPAGGPEKGPRRSAQKAPSSTPSSRRTSRARAPRGTRPRAAHPLVSPEGVEAQTCVLNRGPDTWGHTSWRNAPTRS